MRTSDMRANHVKTLPSITTQVSLMARRAFADNLTILAQLQFWTEWDWDVLGRGCANSCIVLAKRGSVDDELVKDAAVQM